MVSRRVWLAGLATAIAGPYLVLDGNLPEFLQSGRDQIYGRPGPTSSGDGSWFAGSSPATWSDPTRSADALATPMVDLHEALRFDIHPDWIVTRWPRVATVTGELDWAGMRVPLITGYNVGDLAGSLTYYFDHQQRLRRIAIEGYTADERPLAAVAMQSFGLQPEPSLGAGLYTYRWNRQAISVLAVQYAPVVNSEPSQRRVMLEINRPEPGWRLSPHMKAVISPDGFQM